MEKMTRIKKVLFIPILCLFYAGFANAQTYCASKGNLPWEQWIGNVWVSPGTFHNASSKEGYADFTTRPSVPLQRGMSNLFVLTPQASWGNDPKNKELYWRVWIDFNVDGDFADTGEQVISGRVNVSDGIFFDNEVGFSVPSTARLGSTRLRIALKQGGFPEPCETFERGEVEDYTVVITDPNTPIGRDTLHLVGVTGDTAARQGGQVHLNITIRNTGTRASDANTPLSIYTQLEPVVFKGPPPTCYQLASNRLPIGRSLQPNETVTLPFTFTMLNDFTDISPQVYPQVHFVRTDVVIGALTDYFCRSFSYYDALIDTLYYPHKINVLLDASDLATEITVTDTTYSADGVFNFTVKITNKGANRVKNVTTSIRTSPQYKNPITITPQRGTVTASVGLFPDIYYNIWNVDALAVGESLTAQVRVVDTFYATKVTSIVASSYVFSNQIVENNTVNNLFNKTFSYRNTPSNLDLSIVALSTSIVEPNAGNLTSYPLATALKLKYRYTISNATVAQADSLLYFDVYISRDSVLSNDDYRRFRFGGAMGLNRTAESEVFVLPDVGALPNGKYYVFIKIDGTDSFAETNKNNNVSAGIPFVFYGLLCNNAAQNPWGDWISNVKFNTIDNSSDKILFNSNGQFTAGYSAFIALNTSVERGKTYPLSITSSASWSGRLPNHRYTAWIDFNGDGDFDDIGEKVYQGLGTNGISSGNITIPNSATLGKTIMRVAVRNGAYAETCTAYTEGEVEDYFVQITEGASTNNQDIAVSIAATPSVFTKYTPMNFIITAKNNGNQPFTNVKIEFKFPVNTTNGGTATPSVGTWQEWCAGGIQCFTWTIPTFVANGTATLNVPIYVINPTPPMVATAQLLSSTPTDGNTANNTATISINQAAAPALFAKMQATQLIPVVIQTIMPNPSDGELNIDVESLTDNEVVFDFADAFGKVVKTENRKVERGVNRLLFEIMDLPQGIYFLSPSTSTGRNVPIKFVKL